MSLNNNGMDTPRIRPIQTVGVTSAVGVGVGVAVLVVLFIGVGLLVWRRFIKRRKSIKDRPTSLPRRPVAIRSPSAVGQHLYLKKTPSPTGNKSPVGGKSPPSYGDVSPPRSTEDKTTMINSTFIKMNLPEPQERTSPPAAPATESISIENEMNETANDDVDKNIKNRDKSIPYLGKLFFKIKYSHEKSCLVVTIIKATDLPPKDNSMTSSDPYVKLQLLPEKQHKVKTRVMRKTLNPNYEEDFTFYGISLTQLQAITLHFVVLSFDRYSRDDLIGEVITPLTQIEFIPEEEVTASFCKEISPRNFKTKTQGRGELLVSLCHQPNANRLTAVVLKARNLPKMDITGLSDPYVKLYLLLNGQRISKKKTHVKKRTLNPVFNESFSFDLPSGIENLQELSMEFILLDWDRVTKNEVIGRLELGAKCSGSSQHHWNEVLQSPKRQIAEWHKLID